MHAIANARMTRALRSVSSEKGRDPREFALIAYGGAGPGARGRAGRGARLPDRARARRLPACSARSASSSRARSSTTSPSCHLDARRVDPAEIGGIFDALQARTRARRSTGAEAEWVRSAELRYGGQTWEVEVELDAGPVDAARWRR